MDAFNLAKESEQQRSLARTDGTADDGELGVDARTSTKRKKSLKNGQKTHLAFREDNG